MSSKRQKQETLKNRIQDLMHQDCMVAFGIVIITICRSLIFRFGVLAVLRFGGGLEVGRGLEVPHEGTICGVFGWIRFNRRERCRPLRENYPS